MLVVKGDWKGLDIGVNYPILKETTVGGSNWKEGTMPHSTDESVQLLSNEKFCFKTREIYPFPFASLHFQTESFMSRRKKKKDLLMPLHSLWYSVKTFYRSNIYVHVYNIFGRIEFRGEIFRFLQKMQFCLEEGFLRVLIFQQNVLYLAKLILR